MNLARVLVLHQMGRDHRTLELVIRSSEIKTPIFVCLIAQVLAYTDVLRLSCEIGLGKLNGVKYLLGCESPVTLTIQYFILLFIFGTVQNLKFINRVRGKQFKKRKENCITERMLHARCHLGETRLT